MKVWIAASGALVAATFGILAFFALSRYGFLYMHALLLAFTLSCISLLVSLTLWLHRRKLKRDKARAAVSILCALLCVAGLGAHHIIAIFLPRPVMSTSLWLPRFSSAVHESPQGSNRLVIFSADIFDEAIVAYPMVNRWVYLPTAERFLMLGRSWHGFAVTWDSEQLAVVESAHNTHVYVEFN